MEKQHADWLEFRIEVEQELAESVAAALRDIIPDGVVLERADLDVFDHELDDLVGPVKIYGYLPVDDNLETRRQRISRALYFLSRISPLPDPEFLPLSEEDWTETWKEQYQPIPLGSKLIIVPSWMRNPDPIRTMVLMDPGMAFGSGTHPSTQLCLILLEELLDHQPVPKMIDIGCGSGILSIAAVKLGVSEVLGVDIDQTAVQISHQNAVRNQVAAQTRFQMGSVPELHRMEGDVIPCSLIVVNMIAPYLQELLDQDLAGLLKPGGDMIFSGMLENQVSEIIHSVFQAGLKIHTRRQQGEWVALRVQKPV